MRGLDRHHCRINDSDQVVTASRLANGHLHGFLWQNNTLTDLGTLTGNPGDEDSSAALGINNLGQIVGYSAAALPLDRGYFI